MTGFSESRMKGKKPSKIGEVEQRKSDCGSRTPSLAKGLRMFEQNGPKAIQALKLALSNTKKTKERALKEKTNSLEVRPVKLKPNWFGSNLGSGSANKDGRNAKYKTQELGPNQLAKGLPIFQFGDRSGCPNSSHPPDPIQPHVNKDALAEPQIKTQSLEATRGVRKDRRREMESMKKMKPCWKWTREVDTLGSSDLTLLPFDAS